MSLKMADSVQPEALPLGCDAYAGYVNGRWANASQLARMFPDKPIVRIDVTGVQPSGADAVDVERFDVPPEHAPYWVDRCLTPRPIVYVGLANAEKVVQLLKGRSYRLWTAHYTGTVPHRCGPSCGYGLSVVADATQWYSGSYDLSDLAEDFFGRAAPNPGPVAGKTNRTNPQEEPMFIVETIDTKTQFLVFDNGKVAQLHSTAIGSGLTTHSVPAVTGAQADVDNIARGYTPA